MSKITPIPDDSLLNEILTDDQKQFVISSNGKILEQNSKSRLYEIDDSECLIVPTGLISTVTGRIDAAGLEFRMTDHRSTIPHRSHPQSYNIRSFHKRCKINTKVFSRSSSTDQQLLRAVEQNLLGQINVKSVDEMIHQIILICRAFPKARMLIPVAQVNYGKLLKKKIREANPNLIVEYGSPGYQNQQPKRLIINYSVFRTGNPTNWDIILLTDALRASNEGFLKAMASIGNKPHRCYSFVNPRYTLESRQKKLLEAMSGPIIFGEKNTTEAVKVLWLRSPNLIGSQRDFDQRCLDWKRVTLWQNSRRNEQIAAVARSFTESKTRKLKVYGVPFKEGKPQFSNADSPAIVILVESAEHGRALQEQLRKWQLISMSSDTNQQSENDGILNKIVTHVYAANHGFEADVVINAAGGSGLGAMRKIKGESQNADTVTLPAIIVDFADEYDAMSIHDTQNRSHGYRQMGWEQTELPF